MLQFKIICKNGLSKKRQVCIEPKKGGVAMTGASKILALPERGGEGSDPCQDFSGEFDLQYS